MPSIRTSAPTVIHAVPASPKMNRSVGFYQDPVEGVSRPVNTAESWAAYHFEMHARKCDYCHNPSEVHRSRERLCDVGHGLAQEVARFIYNKSDGKTYSTVEEDHRPVRVEIPAGYVEVSSLLKAIERSLRHRSRRSFVSMDNSYYIAPRLPTPPAKRSNSVKVTQEPKTKTKSRPRPHSGEIVEWPQSKRALAEITNANTKRGSLYEEDLAIQRRNANKYRVQVREPSARDLRAAGYYR